MKAPRLVKQTAVYGLSSIIGRFLYFLLVPLYTRVFTDSGEYGVSNWFYAFAAFLGVVYMYGMESAYFRFVNSEDDKDKVYSTAAIAVITTAFLMSAFIIFFAPQLAHISKNDGRNSYFILFALILFTDTVAKIPFARLRQQNKAWRFASLNLISIAVNLGLNLLFYLVIPFLSSRSLSASMNEGAPSIIWMFIANLAGSAVLIPLMLPEWRAILQGTFDAELFKRMLRYAYPIMFMGFAGMINETLDRILLKELIIDQKYAESQIGIYAANYKLSIIITLFIQAFRFAAEPFFFAQSKKEDAPKTYARVMRYFMLVCSTIFVGVLLYLDIIKYFIGKSYHSGLEVVPILLMANVFLGAYYNLSVWFKLTDKTLLGAYVSIGGAIITFVLNFLWIPTYGYIGCAWATLICYFSMSAASYFLGQKYYFIPYPVKTIIATLGWAWCVYMFSETFQENFPTHGFLHFFIQTGWFAIYLGVVALIERDAIQQFISNRKLKS